MDYSVIIRTIGKAGEKYQRLLNSIECSIIKPSEVIVVLPEGFDEPQEQLGYEKFVFCKRGMINQRLVGVACCKTRYALILDDDIEFGPDFVERVSAPVIQGISGVSAGPLLEFFPPKGMSTIKSAICGTAIPTLFHKKRYNTILRTTGYSFNRNIEFGKGRLYETQSAAWTCFFADIDKLREIHFEDELWMDKNGYSTHDDTAMFYKAWINGLNPVIVADALYNHLDAGTSKRNNEDKRAFSSSFNTYVFWYRFIYERASFFGKIWCKICITYYYTVSSIIRLLLQKNSKDINNALKKGKQAAREWVKSVEYESLPDIVRINRN